MDINLTKLDCENIYEAWVHDDKEAVMDSVLQMNPLEAMKFARQVILFHSEDGGIINQIINFILKEDTY